MANHEHYTYRVTGSEEDNESVGLCAESPSLSHADKSLIDALKAFFPYFKGLHQAHCSFTK